jgi:hypothetical protein
MTAPFDRKSTTAILIEAQRGAMGRAAATSLMSVTQYTVKSKETVFGAGG